MNKKFTLIFLLCVYVICSAKKCNKIPAGIPARKPVNLILSNFIGDCKAGNINGVTTNDVSYVVRVEVRYANGGTFENSTETFNTVYNSPTGPDKSTFSTPIDVLNGSFYLRVTVDGKDCSLCAKGGCNPYNFQGYQINNAPPFWQKTNFYPDGNLNEYRIVPPVALRNGGNVLPNCNCKIKL